MTDKLTLLRQGVIAAALEGLEHINREKCLRYHLRKHNCALRSQRGGYVIADRYTTLAEASGLSLEGVQRWIDERKAA